MYSIYSLIPLSSLVFLLPLLLLLLLFFYVVSRLLFPTILTPPYPPPSPADKATSCCYAGSYNPPHLGHLAILKSLSERHKSVHAVVGFNPSKSYPVSPSDRVAVLERACEVIGLKNVKPVMVEGLIWRWCCDNGIPVMYRGIRTWRQDGGEERHLLFQNR